jgi:tetratricopeptide (TPR) repeat protein
VRFAISATALAVLLAGGPIARAATVPAGAACPQDAAVPTVPGYVGWERSSVVSWEEVERHGGIVPDIDEDRSQAPPAWWRYPSPLRSAALLADEAKAPRGLYEAVAPNDLQSGDLLVRTRGAGACGKMTVISGTLHDEWVTIEAPPVEGQSTRSGDPIFFDGKKLHPDALAYRIRVKKDSSLGHVRELERDLTHLERSISERPPLIAKKGAGAVDEKVHDLLDESWSLIADPAFVEDRRVLTGRALALAAALDWPAAAEEAAAVLDDALARTPLRADAVLARAAVFLLAGDAAKALTLAEAATAIPNVPARVHYLLARALSASGKAADSAAALQRYRQADPSDALAVRLATKASTGAAIPLPPPPAPPEDGPSSALQFSATPDHATLKSTAYDFRIEWPIAWRLTGLSAASESGLLIDFSTGRVLREDGEAERATAVVLVQHPDAAGGASELARKGGRNMFPDAKLKPLAPLVPGSHREQFRERAEGAVHQGEVTTLEKNGSVYFLVLNATTASYPKLKDEYASFVKSLVLTATPAPAPARSPGPAPAPAPKK